MTDAEHEQLEMRLQAMADEWIQCIGLQWWHILFYYHRDSGAFGESGEHLLPGSKAHTSASWAYLDAAIHFNLSGLVGYTDTQLEEVVVHELMHIMVHEMRSVANCECEQFDIRHEERVCTTLQRAFAWTKEHFLHAAPEDETPPPSEGTVPDAG